MGVQVQLRFRLTQHSRDEQLMKSLVGYLGCGSYYSSPDGREYGDLIVTKFKDITPWRRNKAPARFRAGARAEKIIPFFDKYPVKGVKSLDYADFKRAIEIIKFKGHLTVDGLEEIRKIKAGMNRGRQMST